MKRTLWTITGLVALATALRLVNLNGRPLWYDEAFALLYAEKSLTAILSGTLTPVQGAAADVHPVAYYFLLHGWMMLVGQSPLAIRMCSVYYGVGTVTLAYRLIRDLFSPRVAAWAALVVAVAPFQIAYSQEARMYAMLGFWSVAALAAWVRAWRNDSLRAWLSFVVCGALALYSHNLGFATFAVVGTWVLVRLACVYLMPSSASFASREREECAFALKTILAGLAMAALFAPWLTQVPEQIGKIGQAYWVARPGLVMLVQTLIAFSFDFENAVFPHVLLPLGLFGALLVLAIIVWQIIAKLIHREHGATQSKISFLAILAFAPVVLVFIVSQWMPVYIIRGLIPASICYAALIGWALAVMPRPARVVFGIPLGVLIAAVLVAFYSYAGFPRGPYSALNEFLRAQSRPGDVVVHSNKLTFFPAHVYDRALPQVFLGDPPGSGSDTLAYPTQRALGLYATTLDAATTGSQRVWLVIFKQAIVELEGTHPHVAWLDAHFERTQTFLFGDMDVILFVRKEQ